MATKPPTPKTTQMNSYDEELAKFAQAGAAIEAPTSNFISTRGGRLSYQGNEIPGNKMNVIIVASMMENHYYTDRFDPDNLTSPKCFAFSEDGTDMAPHELSAEKQSETCATCPHNVFGSADVGRGKACKNIRKLGIITEDGLDDVSAAELAVLKIPVTSVKEWGAYVNSLNANFSLPPFAVVTEVSVVPDPKFQFRIKFKLVGKITDSDSIKALIARRPAVLQELSRPYQPATEEEQPQPSRKGPAAKPGRKY